MAIAPLLETAGKYGGFSGLFAVLLLLQFKKSAFQVSLLALTGG